MKRDTKRIIYRKTSSIRRIKFSRLVLQLSLRNPLKPVENEDVVGTAPIGDAPTSSEWSTSLLSTKLHLKFLDGNLISMNFENLCFFVSRFLEDNVATSSEKFSYIPFGGGRHRCIGESFAYVQIKTIWSVLLRLYEFDLVDNYFPEINYTTMIHTPYNPVIRYRKRDSTDHLSYSLQKYQFMWTHIGWLWHGSL